MILFLVVISSAHFLFLLISTLPSAQSFVFCAQVPYVASFKRFLPLMLKWLQNLLSPFFSLQSIDCHGCFLKAKMDSRLRLRANPQNKQNKAAYRHSYEVSHS